MQEVFKIIIRCPATRGTVDSGLRISGREALTNNSHRHGMVSCSHCGEFHSLETDSFLELDRILAGDDLWRPNP
jgi:hypothetical protein